MHSHSQAAIAAASKQCKHAAYLMLVHLLGNLPILTAIDKEQLVTAASCMCITSQHKYHIKQRFYTSTWQRYANVSACADHCVCVTNSCRIDIWCMYW
jgi:hypothetical protein